MKNNVYVRSNKSIKSITLTKLLFLLPLIIYGFYKNGIYLYQEHYISFIAAVSSDRVQLVKLYPEGDAAARFKKSDVKYIYYYCNRGGLFRLKL